MPEEPALDPELTRLAASLAGLTPATPVLDRDRLFYEAGRRSLPAKRRPWGWPLATALAASLAFGLGVRLAPAPTPEGVPQMVEIRAPEQSSPTPSQPTPTPTTYAAGQGLHPGADALRRREQQLLWDAEALPSMPVSVPTESVEKQLGLRPGSLSDAQLQRFKAALSRGEI
jgi:hypothetical protein